MRTFVDTLSRHWDIGLFGGILLGVFLPLFYLWAPQDMSVAAATLDSQVFAECRNLLCWHRSQGTLDIHPLPFGKNTSVRMGDEVMTVGSRAELLLQFPEQHSEILLNENTVYRVFPGKEILKVEDLGGDVLGHDNGAAKKLGDSKQDDVDFLATNIRYMGELEVEVKSPRPGSKFLVNAFPAKLHASFAFKNLGVSRARPEELVWWKLLKEEGISGWRSYKLLRLGTALGQGLYFGTFSVDEAGRYALVPNFLELSPENIKITFVAKLNSTLERDLGNLIQGLNEGKTQQIELHQDEAGQR